MDVLTLIIILIVIGVIAASYGFYLGLPGYSRDKYLSGYGVEDQQRDNSSVGEIIMMYGVILIIMIIVISTVLGLVIPARYEYGTYKEIDVIHVQGRSFVMADELWYEIDHDKYHWISSDYPGIFFQKEFSTFGIEVHTRFKIVDVEGELYDYDYPSDDEESDDE